MHMWPICTCSQFVHVTSLYMQPVCTCNQFVHVASLYIWPVCTCSQFVHAHVASLYMWPVYTCDSFVHAAHLYMQPVCTCGQFAHAASLYMQPICTCSQFVHAASLHMWPVSTCGQFVHAASLYVASLYMQGVCICYWDSVDKYGGQLTGSIAHRLVGVVTGHPSHTECGPIQVSHIVVHTHASRCPKHYHTRHIGQSLRSAQEAARITMADRDPSKKSWQEGEGWFQIYILTKSWWPQ